MDLLYGHARGDSLIALATMQTSKAYPDLHPAAFAPILNRDRQDMLPLMQEYLAEQTHYIMPNTLKPTALKKHAAAEDDLGLRVAQHNELALRGKAQYFETHARHVRELGVITIDLDVGRAEGDPTAAQALSMVFYQTITGTFPMPSLVAYSGRGAYLMYLLKGDAEGDLAPPLADADTIHKWRMCAANIIRRTRELKADPTCTTLLRWFKAPGSITGRVSPDRTIYMTFGVDSPAKVPRYSLNRMTAVLGIQHTLEANNLRYLPDVQEIDAKQITTAIEKRYSPSKTGKKRRVLTEGRGAEPMLRRAQEIDLLAEYRKGIHEGCRYTACLCHFHSLLGYYLRVYKGDWKRARDEARFKTIEFGMDRCRPSLALEEMLKIFNAKRRLKFRAERLVQDLGVTVNEATALGLRALVPAKLKAEIAAEIENRRKTTRTKRVTQRQVILDLLTKGVTTQEITALLGISRQAVHVWRRKLKAELPKPVQTDNQAALF
jgi:hypothetical protein